MKKIRFIFYYTFLLLTLSSSLYSQTLNLPTRSILAKNGTQIIATLTPLSLTAREDTIFSQIISGNVPNFLRNLSEVTTVTNISGTNHTVNFYVTPDYMALGCDSDYFLCPMTPLLAQRISDYMGYTLPTRKMVNDIWQAATVKMAPQSIPPSAQMTTVPVFAKHDSMVWAQRQPLIAAHPLGELVAGDKKDVVISNQIYGNPAPGRVAIYGWHYQNGTPIQPLYIGHEETYADYSHGIRLVKNEILVDGCMTTVQNILQSTTLNTLLSDEGVISVPRYPVTNISVAKPISFCVLNQAQGVIRIKVKADSNIIGYNVSISNDGKCFDLPSYYNSSQFDISGLIPDSIYFVKIAAVGVNGGVSSYSEVLGATTSGTHYPHYLVINAFDRTTSGNTFDFIRQHGRSLKNNNLFFSSATNEAITDSLVLLDDFNALDYIVGEESTVNETFTDQEQLMLKNSHVPYFISGSEIGWDLDHLGSVSDKDFYHNYLYATYLEDAPNNQASTYYDATFAGPLQMNTSFSYDNGTHGTYDVRYPDVITPNVMGTWYGESIAHFNAFPLKSAGSFAWNQMVYLTIPFETIYPESKRDSIMNWVHTIFFLMVSADETSANIPEFEIFPNPAYNVTTMCINSEKDKLIQLQIMSIDGKIIASENIILNVGKNKIDYSLSKFSEGIYLVSIKGAEINVTKKLIISRY
ncbi:MAG: T9SS type A sorting domain-containing protein [Bacteroidia bacterium]|nr:T9SS type A sorting domain-containing protein [Bacteroidia bacterium]